MTPSADRSAQFTPIAPSSPAHQRNWYAIYTQPRHEQAVTRHLSSKAVETYLPSITTTSRWKDRRVQITTPVFPGYVFTRITIADRRQVISVPGVVRVLSFNGMPAAISDSEIEALRLCLLSGASPKPCPFLGVGERVRVKSGALEGIEGLVVRRKQQCRLVLSVTLINRSLAIEVDESVLEPLDLASAAAALGSSEYRGIAV